MGVATLGLGIYEEEVILELVGGFPFGCTFM